MLCWRQVAPLAVGHTRVGRASGLAVNYSADLVHEATLVHDVASAVHRADEGHLVRSIDERCPHLVHEATP